MNIKELLSQILKEKIHVQKPEDRLDPDDDPTLPAGYVVTGRETDDNGKSTTYLSNEPSLQKYVNDLRRMRKTLKYYEMLPDSAHYNVLKSESLSIQASLRNAEGKLRQLYEDTKLVNSFKNKKDGL